MKKTAILLLVAGLGVLFVLAWLFPVPSVSPFHTEDSDTASSSGSSETASTKPDEETGFSAGEFVFPYYRSPSDKQPAWIFRGTGGTVRRGENERITVQEPRIKHFPETEDDASQQQIEEVRISGEEGQKQPGNIAFVKDNVLVRTSQGGKLTTRQLYANFETDRIYTRSDHRVHVDRTGLSIDGIGFNGNGQLSQFTLRKDIYIQLSTGQLRNVQSGNQQDDRPTTGYRYFISGSGPLKVRLVDETNEYRRWKMSIFDDVFLYRIQERSPDQGALRQTSDLLHVTFVEPRSAGDTSEESAESSASPTNRLRLESIESRGNVHIQDPNVDIQSNHVTMRRNERMDVFLLQGDAQNIRLTEQADEPGTRHRDTNILVSGSGRIERPRDRPKTKESPSFQPSGSATFRGEVYVQRRDTRLQSRSLSVAFTEGARSAASNDGAETGQNALRIRLLEAKKQVLFLTNDFASTGNQLTWAPPTDTIQLTSDKRSIVSDLHNRIIAEQLHIDRSRRAFRAQRSVRTTIRTGRTKGFQLLGTTNSSGSDNGVDDRADPSSTTAGQTTWHLDADQFQFQMQPESNQMQSLQATGHVRIYSDQGRARGHRFRLNRDQSLATLQGKQRKASISQNQHRAFADAFRFQLDHRIVVLKGQKRMRIDLSGDQEESNTSGTNPIPRSELLQITTGAPFVVHRREGRLRVLGPTRVLKPGGRMESSRLNVTFQPETNQIETVRANGNVFVGDTRGAGRGDLLRWSPQDKRLMLRGQPHAVVTRDGNTARFEIISIWNDWNNLRGQRYKWRSPGTIEGTVPGNE